MVYTKTNLKEIHKRSTTLERLVRKLLEGLVSRNQPHCGSRHTEVTKFSHKTQYYDLSHDVASASEITPCNKIDKPLVVYRFTGTVMTSITTLHT